MLGYKFEIKYLISSLLCLTIYLVSGCLIFSNESSDHLYSYAVILLLVTTFFVSLIPVGASIMIFYANKAKLLSKEFIKGTQLLLAFTIIPFILLLILFFFFLITSLA